MHPMAHRELSGRIHILPPGPASGHLAWEECLLERLAPGERAVILWVDDPCLVMGKNQNPWWEIDGSRLTPAGIPLVRRISGGGLVYHDRGNLNWSFLGPREGFDQEEAHRLILGFLGQWLEGLERTPRGDLLWNRRKFSGNALCHRKTHSLHHGTLLYRSDLSSLRHLLAPPDWREWISPAPPVPSRPMETVNLHEALPFSGLDGLAASLGAYLESALGMQVCEVPDAFRDDPLFMEAVKRHCDPAWIFGKTPAFTLHPPGMGQFDIAGGCLPPGASGENSASVPVTLPFHLSAPQLRRFLSDFPGCAGEDLA